ncbi:MAG: DUF3298 domain-containing protein [Anaerovoracaceae bacterium]
MRLHRCLFALMVIVMVITAFCGCNGITSGPEKSAFSVESSYIQENGEHLSINAEYPILKGFPGADQLNVEIREKVEAAAEEVRNAALDLENREGFSASLNSSYQYFHNKDIASLWMSWDNYTGGAHGLYWLDSYTLNTNTGQIYTFPELFQDDSDGLEYVNEKILSEIAEGDYYFESAADTVAGYNGNYDFLINGENLIVYFSLYDIAPYVAGIQSFSFSVDELGSMLKPEVFAAMEGQEPVFIQFFGSDE